MKTKQAKEELEKSTDEETTVEPKTRARKKASDEEDKKAGQDDPNTSKEPKKPIAKPRTVVKKRPLGIRKTLRSKKTVIAKNAVKTVIKQAVKRGRKPLIKTEPDLSPDKETSPLIPVSEIKKEPLDDTTPSSRSSSPRTAGRRQRLSSDIVMMKSVLADSPSTLVHGPRTSPYSMRSERSNSPSTFEGKNLRSGKPRKETKKKPNLLNEVVMKQQNKRRRLLSDSKAPDSELLEDVKKLKRGRSCSRDGSEISKCSDITESDLSLSESLNDTDSKELNKKLDKAKTDLDIDIENNVQISTIEKVPSLNDDSKLTKTKLDTETSCIPEKTKKSLSLKRSTSLDSDNNNSNRIKLENLNSSDIEDKSMIKTENDTLFEARSSILNSMSRTFNSKQVSKNIRKARRGRKAAAATRTNSTPPGAKNGVTPPVADAADERQETLESLSKEIDDLINNLDQNIDRDSQLTNESVAENTNDQLQTKSVSKFYGTSKALSESNSIAPETPVKDKDKESLSITSENTPSKIDDSENIRLHYEDDSIDRPTDSPKHEVAYKCSTVASIDKLMDRLKEFEEFDKRRQRQESESKCSDSKSVMVTNDVVLIPKSGADIKLKDIQTVRSPERPMEKENVLSCFENNSAISILKRDQARKSIDVDLPNTVTLIKRNSISSRKESTSSNHSKETDAIILFEKSLGKDVTLTEIRKSVDKTPSTQVDLHQFATLHPNNQHQNVCVLDTNQISILPRSNSDVQITKRNSRDSLSRKSSESGNEEALATLEKIKSPTHQTKSSEVSITPNPVAIKSPETLQPMEAEALAPPLDSVKTVTEEITLTSKAKPDVPETAETTKVEAKAPEIPDTTPETVDVKVDTTKDIETVEKVIEEAKIEVDEKPQEPAALIEPESQPKKEKEETKVEKVPKTVKEKGSKSARNSIESQPGPSSALHETPESQKRKENVLRTLGLLTHKAAKEAKIEKLKEKERIYGSNFSGMMSNKSKAVKSGSGDYTGTLKTVIKLNRGAGDRDKKKYRSSLKMTFQKSKNRSGKVQPEEGQENNEDDAYYTIERREIVAGAASEGGHRKSYSNRLNNHDGETAPEPEPKETLNLVIPEKASSFSIHPGRLCMDQCFYCGGKFGLFDTPCHIAQMKSSDRQKKVLDNEEKLTIDSCLCDACYRHVDRRANCPSYRKRPAKPADRPPAQPPAQPTAANDTSVEKPPVSPEEEESSEEAESSARPAVCHTSGCTRPADHSIRRKWLIKMRASVNKLLQLEGDYPGLHTIPLCGEHHRALAPLLSCALCKRRLTKHHNAHPAHNYLDINPLLCAAGVPVQWADKPVLCKLCRYYCSLLQRPHHNPHHKDNYTRKLLQIYKIEVPPEQELEQQQPQETSSIEDQNASKSKKKNRTKSKQRKSADRDKPDSESSEKTESSPEKNKEEDRTQPLEEDIESLISSNKIPVPGAKASSEPGDHSENETTIEYDIPLIVDKQTELQYLLQKQNNPAQFLNKIPNLTAKQKNLMKIQNSIQKPGQQQRISDKNAKRIQKIGQIMGQKDKKDDNSMEIFETDKPLEGVTVYKNISLNDECTIESIPNKKPADINTLKNKWQMSESFTQVKKNLSELSKKLTVEKDSKKSSVKYVNPVKRLETNPSISVRELFPGEEEMNLQCSIEFNNVKSVTPEGWEKCNTTIQYDLETKKLWSELQRPYGNQSSFLRHLILLEKYFRNGDLVLSHNATPHAANYSDSVQSRLRAYDNVVNDTPRRAEPAISLIEYRKKPAVNGKSLLKTSQEEQVKKTMPPPGIIPKKPAKSDKKQLPPELIAINTPNAQGRKAIQNVLHNIQQLVKGVSASDPTEVAAAPLPMPKFDPPKEKKDPPKEKKDPPVEKKDPPKDSPSKDTPKKQKPTSKPWRPTLMPITEENLAKIATEPPQVAVDGRILPRLVQVMAAGKRYHITLQDYNKMCIKRRQKLQQLQDKDKKKDEKETSVVTEIQPSAMLGNGGTVVQNIPQEEKKEMPELISSNAATILKNVGLKNITIAPIPAMPAITATVTSQTASMASSPSLLVTSAPLKLPQLGSSVSITSETVLTPNLPVMTTSMIMPKIPKSLTVIPQTVVTNVPQNVVASLPQGVMGPGVAPPGLVMPQGMVVPQGMMGPGLMVPQMVLSASGAADVQRP